MKVELGKPTGSLDYLVKKRLEVAKPFINKDEAILDVGCGPATTYEIIRPKKYVGIERGEEKVKKLKEKFPLVEFYDRDVEKDRFNLNKKFDTILLLAVIEHIKEPELLFKEMINHLNKNGKLVITTPTPFGNFIHTILSFVGITSKFAVKEHCNIYNNKKFIEVSKKYNFKILKYQRFELGCNSLVVMEAK